jgi:hypothetical protein
MNIFNKFTFFVISIFGKKIKKKHYFGAGVLGQNIRLVESSGCANSC